MLSIKDLGYYNDNNNNNGNFICVFEWTIVNLATYRQFTNAAWDWMINKKQTKQNKTKQNNNNNNSNNNNGLLTDPLGGSSLLKYINYN